MQIPIMERRVINHVSTLGLKSYSPPEIERIWGTRYMSSAFLVIEPSK